MGGRSIDAAGREWDDWTIVPSGPGLRRSGSAVPLNRFPVAQHEIERTVMDRRLWREQWICADRWSTSLGLW